MSNSGLMIYNYPEGNFEVIHNGIKESMKNFHHDESRNGTYIMPTGDTKIYSKGKLITQINKSGMKIVEDGNITQEYFNYLKSSKN